MRYCSSSKLSGPCAAIPSVHIVRTRRGQVTLPRAQSKHRQPARQSRCVVHDAYAASLDPILQNGKHPTFVPEQGLKTLESIQYTRHRPLKSYSQSKIYNGILQEDSLEHEGRRRNQYKRNSFGPLILQNHYATSAVSKM